MEVKTIENRSLEDFKNIFKKEIKIAKKNSKMIIKYGEKDIELITNLFALPLFIAVCIVVLVMGKLDLR